MDTTMTRTRCKNCHNVLMGFEQLGEFCNGCLDMFGTCDENGEHCDEPAYCPCCLHAPCSCQYGIDQGARP